VTDLELREGRDEDLPAVLELLRHSMGRTDDPRFEQLFRWKHIDNAYGRSPMWVACDDGVVVGFRVFMRWAFERDGDVVQAARAVDTATHPDYQGRGIFTRLTMLGLDALRDEGVHFIFNTPNDKSRPGYLKMGWRVLGRPRASIRPSTLGRIATLRSARTAAAHWSDQVDVGVPATDFLADAVAVSPLLAQRPADPAWRTALTPEVLAWRFGLPALAYRVVASEDGAAFFRVRRRGDAREGAIALLLGGPRDTALGRLSNHLRDELRPTTDYLLAIGRPPGFVPVPRLGPTVTTRAVAAAPPARIGDLSLTLGDIELF
jgi:predicted N-acetyltransferase YhbS